MQELGLTAGQAIRAYRQQLGLSARSLSLQAGLSESHVRKIESGQTTPTVPTFGAIAHILGMNPREVFLIVMEEGKSTVAKGAERE